jgi:hypothetical protein
MVVWATTSTVTQRKQISEPYDDDDGKERSLLTNDKHPKRTEIDIRIEVDPVLLHLHRPHIGYG